MSKEIVTIPLFTINKIQMYVNSSKKSIDKIKQETGADYILNGGLFEWSWKPCPILKSGGAMYSATPYTQWGYGWDNPSNIKMLSAPHGVDNFISCVELVNPIDGKNTKPLYNKDVGGSRARSAIGLLGDNLVMYCSNESDGKTPEKLRDELFAYGCSTAIMLDGGGSSQCDFNGKRIYSSDGRAVHNLILVYLKKGSSSVDGSRDKFIKMAISQIGVSEPSGDDKYISWYNKTYNKEFPMNVSWCAIFVSWCLRNSGISEDIAPSYHSCTEAISLYKKLGKWRDSGTYAPKSGDIIMFDWDVDRIVSEHTGIVEKVDSKYVYTIEGNSSNMVRRVRYAITDNRIFGYFEIDKVAIPTTITNCQKILIGKFGANIEADGSFGPASKVAFIKALQETLIKDCGAKISVDGSWGPASKKAFPTIQSVKTGNIAYLCQIALVVNGFSLSLDGSYGPSCKRAVISFEKYNGLSQNGELDKYVMTKLIEKMKGTALPAEENPPIKEEPPHGVPPEDSMNNSRIKNCQKILCDRFGCKVDVDGSWGPASKKALITAIQKTVVEDYGKEIDVDGSFGQSTRKACPDVKATTSGNIAYCIQIGLAANGYDVDIDGSYGNKTEDITIQFQDKCGITANGVCGKSTFAHLVE